MIEVKLDYLFPTTNHAYGIARKGRKAFLYKTTTAKSCQQILELEFSKYVVDPTDYFGLYICVYLKKNQRDISSMTKLLQDAIAAGLKINDNRVLLVIEEKIVDKKESEGIELKFGLVKEIKDMFVGKS